MMQNSPVDHNDYSIVFCIEKILVSQLNNNLSCTPVAPMRASLVNLFQMVVEGW